MPLWDVDLYGQSLDLEPAEIPCFKPDFFNIQAQHEPYTDEDLIDRQLEADCPGLYANHSTAQRCYRQWFGHEGNEEDQKVNKVQTKLDSCPKVRASIRFYI